MEGNTEKQVSKVFGDVHVMIRRNNDDDCDILMHHKVLDQSLRADNIPNSEVAEIMNYLNNDTADLFFAFIAHKADIATDKRGVN